ncbi:MarR family winged helix-turn-helix transcriptional regulator [Streptomyces sp. AK02-01A]|uniref:MarR family winged helix-turn-helix transcriptional regulator n=1 Tax=Streptomyces sp. AK02-01A TaxID=3028648 RepID=UPI0029A7BCED|nr:MarR family transcriptional regulator [Streptomyces sp. AK02-01A]MDX3851837.1 MarR family transcriptional regulator [Streptomyces sp. AK02-01A]
MTDHMKNQTKHAIRAGHEAEETGSGPAAEETGTGQVAGAAGNLGAHIKRADQAIMARKAEALRGLDLTVPQCRVLGFLVGGAAKSCTQLSREALVTSQTMTGIVKNLEAKGLVERRTSPDHGRVVLVSLTPAGIETARRASVLSDTIERGVLDALSDGDHALLIRLLDRVAEAAPVAGIRLLTP